MADNINGSGSGNAYQSLQRGPDPVLNFDISSEWLEKVSNLSPASDSFSLDGSSASLVIDVPWEKRFDAILYCLGYAVTRGESLHRQLPVRHPYYHWLYCTKITSISGVKFDSKQEPVKDGLPAFANYTYARMTLAFEAVPFNVLNDEEVTTEAQRFVSVDFEPSVEALTYEGGQFKFAEGPTTVSYPNSIGRLLPKAIVRLTWHRVPYDWLFAASAFLPTNLMAGMGKVNSTAFFGFPAGTLLMEAPQFQRKVMPLIGNNGVPLYFYDVTIPLRYYDPQPTLGSPYTRGHNLFPYRAAVEDPPTFYLATHNGALPNATPTPGRPVYDSYEFLDLFKKAGASS